MRLNIILGIDIDTNGWIKKIKAKNKDSLIIVVDFEYNGKPYIQNGVKFFSSKDGMNFAKKFEKVIYYKSLYAYPMIDWIICSILKNKYIKTIGLKGTMNNIRGYALHV